MYARAFSAIKGVSQRGWGRLRFVMVIRSCTCGHRTHYLTIWSIGPVSFHMPSGLGPGRRRHWPSRRLRRRHLRAGRRRHLRSRRLLAPHSSRRSALEHAAAGSSACKTRSQPAARSSCLSVSARPCVQYAARVHAKLAMAKCHDGSLEIWPVTDSAVTWHESGEEALRIGKGARSTNGRAARQRYLKEKHARLVLGRRAAPG